INPIYNDKLPLQANDIINRLNEITFNSSLIAEMRAIEFVSRLIAEGRLEHGRYKDMRIHLIYSQNHMHEFDASSKMSTDWEFFQFLKTLGRQACEHWLHEHHKDIGVKSSVNIREKFLRGPWKNPYWSDLSEKEAK